VEQLAGGGVEEDGAGDVALLGRPVLDTGEQPQAARVVRQYVGGAADNMGRARPQGLQQQLHTGPDRTGRRVRRPGRDGGSPRSSEAGDTARLVARVVTDATVYGTHADWRLRLTMDYARPGDTWAALRSVATTW
jgi:hypothetical protein